MLAALSCKGVGWVQGLPSDDLRLDMISTLNLPRLQLATLPAFGRLQLAARLGIIRSPPWDR